MTILKAFPRFYLEKWFISCLSVFYANFLTKLYVTGDMGTTSLKLMTRGPKTCNRNAISSIFSLKIMYCNLFNRMT